MSLKHQVDNMCKKLRKLPQNSSRSGSMGLCKNQVDNMCKKLITLFQDSSGSGSMELCKKKSRTLPPNQFWEWKHGPT